MIDDRIMLDKKTMKALSADTRIQILKLLAKRNYLQSEISEELNLKPPTVKEHLDALADAGLVNKLEEGRKWKYFELTSKANAILHPEQKKIWLIIAAMLFTVIGGVFGIIKEMLAATTETFSSQFSALGEKAPVVMQTATKAAAAANETAGQGLQALPRAANEALMQSAPTAHEAIRTLHQAPSFAIMWIGLGVLVILLLGLLAYYGWRNKRYLKEIEKQF